MKLRINKDKNQLFIADQSGMQIHLGQSDYFESGPKLLDVSITNYCTKECNYCYKNSGKYGKHMSLTDFDLVLKNATDCKVYQIALGGGNPNEHPDFINILKKTRAANIVPNYSTNGMGLTDEILAATKDYCGAMALSIHGDILSYKELIRRIVNHKIKLNLQFVMSHASIENAIRILESPPEFLAEANALVFLNYKPIGKANREDLLSKCDHSKLKTFFNFTTDFEICKLGFDSCLVSYVVKMIETDFTYYDYCEAARKSAYIDENLIVRPCSFFTFGEESLLQKPLRQIWDNNQFKQHRKSLMKNDCAGCDKFSLCHGGCQILKINNTC